MSRGLGRTQRFVLDLVREETGSINATFQEVAWIAEAWRVFGDAEREGRTDAPWPGDPGWRDWFDLELPEYLELPATPSSSRQRSTYEAVRRAIQTLARRKLLTKSYQWQDRWFDVTIKGRVLGGAQSRRMLWVEAVRAGE